MSPHSYSCQLVSSFFCFADRVATNAASLILKWLVEKKRNLSSGSVLQSTTDMPDASAHGQ